MAQYTQRTQPMHSSKDEFHKRSVPDDIEGPGPSMEFSEVPIKQEIPDDTYEPETPERYVPRILKHSRTASDKTYKKKARLADQPIIKNEEMTKYYPGTLETKLLPPFTFEGIQLKQEPLEPDEIENNTVSDMSYQSCDTNNTPEDCNSFYVEIKKEYDTDLPSEAMDLNIEDALHETNIVTPQGSTAVEVEIKIEKNTDVPLVTAAIIEDTSNITIDEVKAEPQEIYIEDTPLTHELDDVDNVEFQKICSTSSLEHFSNKAKFLPIDEMLNDLVRKDLLSLTDKHILAKQNIKLRLLQDNKQKIHPKLKYFAITLYISSHKAYEYVLANCKTALPPVSTLRNWLIQPRAHSGFKKEALDVIRTKATISKSKRIFVCLELKDVKMTSSVCDTINDKPLDRSYANARGAFVMTAVAMNAEWKLPIGYFWTNVVKNSERANLIKIAITFLEAAGVEPLAVSLEYNTDNLQMCSEMKCSIDELDLKTSFLSESGKPILLFPEPRGILESIYMDSNYMDCLVDESLQVVSLTHLPLLMKNYDKTATLQQLLRKAIASELCKYNCPSDVETAGTVTFLKNIHIVLDVLSSRKGGVDFKSPVPKLTHVNSNPAFVALQKAGNYFKGLRMKDSTQPRLWTTDRGRGILVLCALIDSALILISKYSSELYIQFGKFINSTHFLANISLKHKRNPTVQYFQREYKKMMQYIAPSKIANNKQTKRNMIRNLLLIKYKSPIDRINLTTNIPNGNNTWHVDDGLWKLNNGLSEYEDMLVVYIARYITNSLIQQLKCEICVRAIHPSPLKCVADNSSNVQTRFAAKLEDPSPSAMDICKTTDAAFRKALMHGLDPQLNVHYLVIKVMKKYTNRPLFENVFHHQFDTDGTCNHLVELLRAVAELYLETRVKLLWKQNKH